MLEFCCLSGAEVDMDTLIAAFSGGINFVADRYGTVLILLATVPSVLFFLAGRTGLGMVTGGWVLELSALAGLAAAVMLIWLGVESLLGAATLAAVNSLLLSLAVLSTWGRQKQVEVRLDAAIAAIHDLEMIEERRKILSVKDPADSSFLRDHKSTVANTGTYRSLRRRNRL